MQKQIIEIYQTGKTNVTGLGKTKIMNIMGQLKNEGIKVSHFKTRTGEVLQQVK